MDKQKKKEKETTILHCIWCYNDMASVEEIKSLLEVKFGIYWSDEEIISILGGLIDRGLVAKGHKKYKALLSEEQYRRLCLSLTFKNLSKKDLSRIMKLTM